MSLQDSGANPHHLILLADPQLVDPHTYPGRPWPLSSLTIRHTDQYLRRSFSALDISLDPETVLFLGDLFDGGREWSTPVSKSADPQWHKYGQEYWLREYERFGNIFLEPWQSRTTVKGKGRNRKLIANLPGNHDLGLGNGIQLPVRRRFHTFFGLGDRVDIIGNHTFVSIDAVSLSAKSQRQTVVGDPDPALWEPSEVFLSNVQKAKEQSIERALRMRFDKPENLLQSHNVSEMSDGPDESQSVSPAFQYQVDLPTIILSHVPFYRQPGTPCGPVRERWPPANAGSAFDPDASDEANAIRVGGFGYQYQNVLNDDLSQDIVSKVGHVKHIFSGDDHDYCQIVHKDLHSDGQGIPEITVKSTSWAMGVRKPGFLLVSLWNPLTEDGNSMSNAGSFPSIQTHLCLLPDQLGIFIRYGFLLIVTLLVLGGRALIISGSKVKSAPSLLPLPVSTPTSAKIDTGGRERGNSASYVSSANSSDSNGLAVRSSAGRSRPLSPAQGYGFEHGYGTPNGSENSGSLSPAPVHAEQLPYTSYERDKKRDSLYFSEPRVWRKARPRHEAIIAEFLPSVFQVACLAFLWYLWLAYTI